MHHPIHQGKVSRLGSGLAVDGSLPISQETGEVTSGHLSFVQTEMDNCQNSYESPRSYDFNDRSHTLGWLASKTTAVGNSEPVGSQSTPAEQEMLVKSQSSAFPQVVEILHSGHQ